MWHMICAGYHLVSSRSTLCARGLYMSLSSLSCPCVLPLRLSEAFQSGSSLRLTVPGDTSAGLMDVGLLRPAETPPDSLAPGLEPCPPPCSASGPPCVVLQSLNLPVSAESAQCFSPVVSCYFGFRMTVSTRTQLSTPA